MYTQESKTEQINCICVNVRKWTNKEKPWESYSRVAWTLSAESVRFALFAPFFLCFLLICAHYGVAFTPQNRQFDLHIVRIWEHRFWAPSSSLTKSRALETLALHFCFNCTLRTPCVCKSSLKIFKKFRIHLFCLFARRN